MAGPGDIAKAVSSLTAVPLGTVKFYQAALRSAGIVQVNGRGRSAKSASVHDVTALLIVAISAKSADDVPAAYARALNNNGSGVHFEGAHDKSQLKELHEVYGKGWSQRDSSRNVRIDYVSAITLSDLLQRSIKPSRRLGWIELSTLSVYCFVYDAIQACITDRLFPTLTASRGAWSFRPDSFLDYDESSGTFEFHMAIPWGEDNNAPPPGGRPATLSVSFPYSVILNRSPFRRIGRLHLDACAELAKVVAPAQDESK